MNQIERKQILKLVKDGDVTPEDGLTWLKLQKKLSESFHIDQSTIAERKRKSLDIAVIGMSARFPGADTKEQYWQNLKNGINSITEIPNNRWNIEEYYDLDERAEGKTYCRRGGFINDVDKFDSLFFNISPKEAQRMDPQQRIFLEESWRALEDAGYSDIMLQGKKCGVFVGVTQGDYATVMKEAGYECAAETLTGLAPSILASRISYFLDLKGPSVAIETACSSSLVAIHEACMSIINEECDMAISGGINLMLTHELQVRGSQVGMLSKEGNCRTFDNRADGTLLSEGVGVVVLKPLKKALEDNDNIYGIIKGSGINQDGKTNGITAPSAKSQSELETQTYKKYDINPENIIYVEAHGTATKLGDPIEVKALSDAFRNFTTKKQYCAMGSVKTNIGHATIAAGVSGFIKVLLSLRHMQILPSINFEEPNEHINFKDSPFFVNTTLKDINRTTETSVLMAISSFGFSGTNCHMVIEQAPIRSQYEDKAQEEYYFIPLSAKKKEALKRKIEDLQRWLEGEESNSRIKDLSYTLSVGRSHLSVRYGFWVNNKEMLHDKLNKALHELDNIELSRNEFEVEEKVQEFFRDLCKSDEIRKEEGEYKRNQLTDLYRKGYEIDLQLLFKNSLYYKIPMPTYPFEKESHWIGYKKELFIDGIDFHESMTQGITFKKHLKSKEPYVRDYSIHNSFQLSMGVMIEMLYSAFQYVCPDENVCISELKYNGDVSIINEVINITIDAKDFGYNWYISLKNQEEKIILAEGKAIKVQEAKLSEDKQFPITEIKSLCDYEISGDTIYETLEANGYCYGEYFQVITKAWKKDTELLAKLSISKLNEQNLKHTIVAPALLEAAAQILCFEDISKGNSVCLTDLRNIRYYKTIENLGYVYIKHNKNHTSSIAFFDEDGILCLAINEVVNNPKKQLSTKVYPLSKAWDKVLKPYCSEKLYNNLTLGMKQLRKYYSSLLLQAFIEMKAFKNIGEFIKKPALCEKVGVIPKYYRLFNRLLDVLQLEGFIDIDDQTIKYSSGNIEEQYLNKIKMQMEDTYPFLIHHIRLLEQCIKNYPQILRGSVSPAEIMFPNGEMRFVEKIYQGNEITDYYNSLVVATIINYWECFKNADGESKIIKILEVGAGTGGTSNLVLEKMKQIGIEAEYCYTDISSTFTSYGNERYGKDYKNIKFKLLNIEKDIIQQGFNYDQYNIIIAANVLHATKNIQITLDHIRQLLKQGGCLILNESTGDNLLATLTFGLLDGWWNFQDDAKRIPGSPLLSIDKWNKALLESGFNSIKISNNVSMEMGDISQNIIVASKENMESNEMNQKADSIQEKQVEVIECKIDNTIKIKDKNQYIEDSIVKCFCDVLNIRQQEVSREHPFTDYGVDSITAVGIINKINDKLSINLRATDLFNYSNFELLKEYVLAKFSDLISYKIPEKQMKLEDLFNSGESLTKVNNVINDNKKESNEFKKSNDIAVIGISANLPGAHDVDVLWNNLMQGKDSVKEITRWNLEEFYSPKPGTKGKSYSKWGGLIDDIDMFDYKFFHITPKEAELMDPQQRLFLTEAQNAFLDAGYSNKQLNGTNCGVFVGCGSGDYDLVVKEAGIEASAHSFLGTISSVLAARISYFLNLKGTNISIDTACSSSLVAIHQACESIQNGSCSMALAGGVSILSTPAFYISTSGANMLSPTGRCKSFANSADGFVPGEGVGAVVLKELNSAIRDGDNIYGVICGSGVNYDGKTNGIMAPNGPAQSMLEREVYIKNGINPEEIGYIEAHGSGTKLGDPLEFDALTDTFREFTSQKTFCAIGSIKSNTGHQLAAAGIAGFIKALLCLKNKKLVPSLHFDEGNEHINFKDSPFFVNTELKNWVVEDTATRYAAVSSFGVGGTNAHLVIREFRNSKDREVNYKTKFNIATFSGKTEKALEEMLNTMCGWSRREDRNESFHDICYTLVTGRDHYAYRKAFVADSISDLIDQIQRFLIHKKKVDSTFDKEESQDLIDQKGNTLINELRSNVISENEYLDKFTELVSFYEDGYNLNWNDLYEKNIYNKVSLPTYSFDKVRVWLSTPKLDTRNNFILLKTDYKRTNSVGKDRMIKGAFLVLVNEENYDFVKDVLSKYSELEAVYVCNSISKKEESKQIYKMDFASSDDGNHLYNNIINKNNIRGILDFSDIKVQPTDQLPLNWGKILLLQQFLKANVMKEFIILQFTSGLNSFKNGTNNLLGADFAGFVKAVGAEYSKTTAKTIDVDDMIYNKELLQHILQVETNEDREITEVCYRNGERYLPQIQIKNIEKFNTKSQCILSVNKVYVITGGTGELGLLALKYLVDKGAKRIVLMGKNKLHDRTEWNHIINQGENSPNYKVIKNIVSSEKNGVDITVYTGSLCEDENLTKFFNSVRGTMGEIGGVIHCAGYSNQRNPAFINKEIQIIKQVFEPKVTGLLTLFNILKNDYLEFFLLYSSISSIIPCLSAGVSDYAAANGFMNYFAEFQCTKGNTYVKAINWPIWGETKLGEVKSALYYELGLKSHQHQEGIQMLDYILSYGENCVLPCKVEMEEIDPDNLTKVSKSKEAKNHIQLIAPVNELKSKIMYTKIASNNLIDVLKEIFIEELRLPSESLNEEEEFDEMGIDSIILSYLIEKIEKKLSIVLEPSVFWEHPTFRKLSIYLAKKHENLNMEQNSDNICEPILTVTESKHNKGSDKIAIIGMSCHFPKANNKEVFWDNLKKGINSIGEVPKSRWDISKLYSSSYEEGKSISKWGGFIDDIEYFDSNYFKISEEDAPYIDPLVRQFLEVSAETLADAGYNNKEISNKKIGVFAGARAGAFSLKINKYNKRGIIGMGQNFIAAHVSHFFNLKGPSLVVDSACSSSLLSIQMACSSIINGESEMALAGGVDIVMDEKPYIMLSDAKALSPDGQCHTFDEKANGFVPGEGCGIVLLKHLDRAIADGDKIYAIVEATAVNNDGHTMGITTPNPDAQMEVITDALKNGGIDPRSISYVETHGTGTMIGDPIELKALSTVYRNYSKDMGFCAVGSVKTNFGHLMSAAGVASFIKVVLSIKNQHIPPTLNCSKPNPRFEFDTSPFYPNKVLKEWKSEAGILRAGVSSFGFGGTNVHMILCNYKKEYEPRRKALPSICFNKKKYWPADDNDNEEHRFIENNTNTRNLNMLKLKKIRSS